MAVFALEYCKWFCATFVSCDWHAMNSEISDGVLVNVPLCAVIVLHVLFLIAVVRVAIDWLIVSPSRKSWYCAGFRDGAQSRAVLLAQIKFGKEPKGGELVLWEPDAEAIGRESDACYVALREAGV